jgi:UDP-glucose 4-epimerase
MSIHNLTRFPEVFNLGTGKGNTVLEVIHTFEKVNHVKVKYVLGQRRSGDVESIYANTHKANTVLGWQCNYTLADALEHAWKWENKLHELKTA